MTLSVLTSLDLAFQSPWIGLAPVGIAVDMWYKENMKDGKYTK